MPKVGDRVIIEGAKIGQQRREGSLIGITGRLLNVRWNDGSTSLLTPGAGSVRFLPKSSGAGAKTARSGGSKSSGNTKKAAKKASVTTKATARKAAPKTTKTTAKKKR